MGRTPICQYKPSHSLPLFWKKHAHGVILETENFIPEYPMKIALNLFPKLSKNLLSLVVLTGVTLLPLTSFALGTISNSQSKFTTQSSDVIATDDIQGNPLRDGTYDAVAPGGSDGTQTNWQPQADDGNFFKEIVAPMRIKTYSEIQSQGLRFVKSLVNYALGLVSFVALCYLIYHGFLMVTAAGDDKQYNKGMDGVKFAAIALVGLGVSRYLVSFAVGVIDTRLTTSAT